LERTNRLECCVSVLDPHWIWILIGSLDPDPDPKRQKWSPKWKINIFKLQIALWGLEASVLRSFLELGRPF
jgi:hypothetical protein